MQLRWDWQDGEYDESIVIEPTEQRVTYSAEYRNWDGPQHARPGGGRVMSFAELIQSNGVGVPEEVRATVLQTVRGLLR